MGVFVGYFVECQDSAMNVAPALEQEFLPLRAKLLEIASALDRLEREGSMSGEPRMARIRSAIEVLRDSRGDRAEQLQLVFSRPYDADWRAKLRMTNSE